MLKIRRLFARRTLLGLIAATLASVALFSKVYVDVHAAPGDLDAGFLTSDRVGTVDPGVSRIFFPNSASNDAAASNAASDFASFAGVQADGKIVVIGMGGSPIRISAARLNTDGTRDTSYGGVAGGKVAIPIPSPIAGAGNPDDHRNPQFRKAVMIGDKTAVLAQITYGKADGGSPTNVCQSGMFSATDFLIIMLNADGTLDTNFDGNAGIGNGNGIVRVSGKSCDDSPFGIGVQTDGKLVIGGTSTHVPLFDPMNPPPPESFYTFFRLNTDGTLDLSYDTDVTDDGFVFYSIPANSLAASDLHVIQSGPHQNKAILFGAGQHSGHSDIQLNRIDDHGVVDMAFGGGTGLVLTHVNNNGVSTAQGLIYSDGTNRLLVGGYAIIDPDGGGPLAAENQFLAARYSVDGTLDTAGFGPATGYATAGSFPGPNGACSLQTSNILIGVDSAGQVILGGQAVCPDAAYYNGNSLNQALVRLTSAGLIDAGFGTGGRVLSHFDPSGGVTDIAVSPQGGTIQPDGKILAVGQLNVAGSGETDMYVARFLNEAPAPPSPNQPPVNTVPGAQSVPANGSRVFSSGNGNAISIADPDAGSNTVTVTVTVTNGTFTLNGTAGLAFGTGDGTADATMTFTGTIANINVALNGSTYTPTGGYTGGATLTINTNDNGNTGSGGAQSDNDVVAMTVTAINTITTVVSAPAASVFSQPVTFTATVAPIPVSGTITFIEGGTCAAPTTTLSGPTAINGSGQASFPTSSLTVGSHTVTACYSGGGGFAASSGNNTHVVSKADTTTTITSDNPDASVFGQDYTVVVTVAPVAPAAATPTGSVTVSDGTNNCNIAALAGGSGSCVLPSTSPGAKTLTATYAATTNFNGSSDTEPHTVSKADTTTVLVSAPGTTTYGQNVTLTATMTTNAPGSGTPAGTVNFLDGGNPIASCQNVAVNGSGVAACTVDSLNAGVGKVLSAVYSGNANFNGSTGGTAQTIDKAPLTVTADPKSRVYGAANPALTHQISGFVLGQTLATSGVTGTPAISTTATAGSNVGSYPISVSAGTLASSNYSFSFTDSTLQVTPAPLTVTADNKSRTYGAANPALTHQFSGFVLGQTLATSGVTGSPAISTPATAGSPVGAYPINIAAGTLAATNYSFNFVDGTLSVTPAQLTVTADDKGRVYGQANPVLTYQFAGFVNGETLATSGVTGVPAISTTATQFSAPGTYPITVTQGTLGAGNYTFAFANGTLTVAKAATTTVITNAAALAATTNVGQGYAVNFAVAPVAPGSGTPTGTVTVSDGTATCSGNVAANGTGSCTLVSTTPGDKTITATYGGDVNFTGSTSAGVAHRVVILIAGNIKQFVNGGPNTNLAGVTVVLAANGATIATATTDANGNYSFALLTNNANIGLAPFGLGKTYEAISRGYSNVTNNITNADFIAYDSNGVNSLPREMKVVNTVGTPGQSVTVPITVSSLGNETSMSFTLAFDQALMGVPTSAVCGADFAGCTVTTFNTGTPGRVGITVGRPAPPLGGGVIREVARVTFPTFVNTAGSVQISFADAPTVRSTLNAAGDPLPTLYTGGFVSFTPDLEGDVVGPNGGFPGGDGVLANDVTIVRQMALGLMQPTAAQYRYADTAPRSTLGDGCPINSTDVTQAARYNLGLDAPTGAGGPAAPIPGGCPPGNTRGERDGAVTRVVGVTGAEAAAGELVTVALRLDSQGDEAALSFGVNFDAEVLRFVRAEVGADAPAGTRVSLNRTKAGDGVLGLLIDGPNPFEAGSRQIVTVTFEVAGGAAKGTYPIEFSSDLTGQSTSGAGGELLDTGYRPGVITIARRARSTLMK